MAREDDPTRRDDDPFRPDATPPDATPEMRDADDALHDRDAARAPARELDPAARPGTVPPTHAADSPSSGAHSAVEAPRTGKGRTTLILVVGAVLAIALAFLLLGLGAEEVEDAGLAPATGQAATV